MYTGVTGKFDPTKDFSAPIGMFIDRLLGDGLDPVIRETAAQVQALLVVFDKHIHYDIQGDPEAAKVTNAQMKSDFGFKNMFRQPNDLKNDLLGMIPAEIDLDQEILDARSLVDAGQGVPKTVPGFGMILSKFVPKDMVNACLQVQAGLRLMAIENEWEGVEKIPEARSFPNDPKELQIVQNVWNDMHKHFLHNDDQKSKYRAALILPYVRLLGYTAIGDGAEKLELLGQEFASMKLIQYMVTEPGVEKNYSYEEAAQKYSQAAANNSVLSPKP